VPEAEVILDNEEEEEEASPDLGFTNKHNLSTIPVMHVPGETLSRTLIATNTLKYSDHSKPYIHMGST
jgi:hypothetical protein